MLIKQPDQGSNILDLIFSSEIDLVTNVDIDENFRSSDHQII